MSTISSLRIQNAIKAGVSNNTSLGNFHAAVLDYVFRHYNYGRSDGWRVAKIKWYHPLSFIPKKNGMPSIDRVALVCVTKDDKSAKEDKYFYVIAEKLLDESDPPWRVLGGTGLRSGSHMDMVWEEDNVVLC